MDEESRWIHKVRTKADREAADRLVNKYYKEIYAYAYRQTVDKELSMDLTQDIFVGALRSLEGFDEHKASFRTWLYRIATNKIVDYFRSGLYRYGRDLVSPVDVETIEESSLNPFEEYDRADFTIELERRQDIERITNIVNHLSADDQKIMRLKVFAECTFKEIAELLHLPESTIKTRYYALLRRIRKLYEKEEFENADEHRRKRTV